jgi:hypothetical protein
MSLGEQAGLAAADYIRSGEFRTPDVQNQAFHLPG